MQKSVSYPVFDLHCDLLSYLAEVPNADPAGTGDMGATLPYLQKGNVKLQVMAIYADAEPGSTKRALKQVDAYRQLLRDYADYFTAIHSSRDIQQLTSGNKIGIIPAIENATGLCEPDEPIEKALERLNNYRKDIGPIAYIGITHHTENRFGGGNMSTAGLKDDGRHLLDHLDGQQIAIDLSHTSDALAEGIFEHVSKHNLKVDIIASHSNFREVWSHARNLPKEFVQEIIQRNGLIGMNFLRAYVDNNSPETLYKHIAFGFINGAEDVIAYGADYFYTKDHPDLSRRPFYFPEHENAEKYPKIQEQLQQQLTNEQLKKLSYGNVLRFYSKQLG